MGIRSGPKLVAKELFVIPACLKQDPTFAHPYGCPTVGAFGHDAIATFCKILQNSQKFL